MKFIIILGTRIYLKKCENSNKGLVAGKTLFKKM